MNRAAFQIPGSVSASHPGSDIWTYLANHQSQSKNKEVLLSLLLQLKDSCKINAGGFFFFVAGHSTVKLKRLKRGTTFSLGNPGIGGLPKLRGQNVMTPLPFRKPHSDISFYLGKQLPWKIARYLTGYALMHDILYQIYQSHCKGLRST